MTYVKNMVFIYNPYTNLNDVFMADKAKGDRNPLFKTHLQPSPELLKMLEQIDLAHKEFLFPAGAKLLTGTKDEKDNPTTDR